MPKKRHPHRKTIHNESQKRHFSKWWFVGFLSSAILGGITGYTALLNDTVDSQGTNFFITPAGARFLTTGSGSGIGLLLVSLLFIVIHERNIGTNNLHRSLIWCSFALFIVGVIGALLGFFSFPETLPVPLRILFGIFIGLFALNILTGVLVNPKVTLNGLDITGCLQGCCSFHFVFFIALTSMISGFLIWHIWLLGLITGGFILASALFSSRSLLISRKSVSTTMLLLTTSSVPPTAPPPTT